MLDIFSTDQQDLQSPLNGQMARSVAPTIGEAFAATKDANGRVDSLDAAYQNQRDFLQQRMDAFTAKTGVTLPKPQDVQGAAGDFSDRAWIDAVRDRMQDEAQDRNDPSLAPPSDQDIAAGGLQLARGAVRRQAELQAGPSTPGSMLGSTAASTYASATDPYNAVSAAALILAPEGAPLLAAALRTGAAMAGQSALSDAARFGYRQQVNPDYGLGDVAGDVAGGFAGGALFGAGHALGGEGQLCLLQTQVISG